jgi:hypothetical protein
MPGQPQLLGKIAHGGKDGNDFLGVVQDVIGFLPNLHQHVNRVAIGRREPAVYWIKLITKDQAEYVHDFPWRFRRQRSEQYLTSTQTAAHFFRQKYGRPQQMQILLGRSDFFVARIQNASMVKSVVNINELSRRIQQKLNEEQNLFCPRQQMTAIAIIS